MNEIINISLNLIISINHLLFKKDICLLKSLQSNINIGETTNKSD